MVHLLLLFWLSFRRKQSRPLQRKIEFDGWFADRGRVIHEDNSVSTSPWCNIITKENYEEKKELASQRKTVAIENLLELQVNPLKDSNKRHLRTKTMWMVARLGNCLWTSILPDPELVAKETPASRNTRGNRNDKLVLSAKVVLGDDALGEESKPVGVGSNCSSRRCGRGHIDN